MSGDNDVYIGAAKMIRFGKYPNKSTAELGREVIKKIIAEEGLDAGEIGCVYAGHSFGGALDGQVTVAGEVALRGTGIEDVPVFTVNNACAAAATAVQIAANGVKAGEYESCLVVGMDKLYATSRMKSMMALFGAMDVDEMSWIGERLRKGGDVGSIFMENYYAKVAREYMEKYGATKEDYGKIAVKNRTHASINEFAQYQDPLTIEEVLSAPLVAEPLTQLMCSPISDGAAVLWVGSEEGLRARNKPLVKIGGSAVRSGCADLRGGRETVTRRAAREAYKKAGLTPEDVDLMEVHDASAVAELIAVEELLLKEEGEGLDMLRAEETGRDGPLPVNVSGGLLSRGHPGAATGAAQLVELVWQLQGEAGQRQINGVRIGVAQSSGGSIGEEPAVVAVTILERVDS